MREQILQAILTANHVYGLGLDPDGETTGYLADDILQALATVPEGTPEPTITTVPAETRMVTVDATEIVAMLASASARIADPEESGPIVTDWYAEADYRSFRQFLFAISDLFGVRVRSTTTLFQGAQVPVYRAAGRYQHLTTLRLVMETFHDLGQPIAEGMTPERATEFWATLGQMVASTARAEQTRANAADAYAAASTHLVATYGPVRTLARAEAVSTSDPVYAAATSVLADAATRL